MKLLSEFRAEEQHDSIDWSRCQDRFSAIADNISQVVVASPRTIRSALLGLFAQGHILVEDVPGVGKTLLSKALASSIAASFTRIQFTPDLLPTDITGTSIFDLSQNRFEFVPGPIFANIVLADEVNRTGPRTQSALLEAMGEQQVTVDGTSRPLPRPFMVIATQNTIESYGTFPLPNSQLDRFMLSMNIGLPSPEQELEILTRSEHGMPEIGPVLTTSEVVEVQEAVRRVQVAEPVKQYIVNVVAATREHTAVAAGVKPERSGGPSTSVSGLGGLRRTRVRRSRGCEGSRSNGAEPPPAGRWGFGRRGRRDHRRTPGLGVGPDVRGIPA